MSARWMVGCCMILYSQCRDAYIVVAVAEAWVPIVSHRFAVVSVQPDHKCRYSAT